MSTTTRQASPFPTTAYPCPSWCALPAGHGWESVSNDRKHLMRYHVLGDAEVAPGTRNPRDLVFVNIEACESVPARPNLDEEPTAESHLDAPEVVVHFPDRPALLNAREARAFADALANAVHAAAGALEGIAR